MLSGKDESAAVWWTAPPPQVQKESPEAKTKPKQIKSIWHQSDEEEPVSLELTGWEVLRYRKDKSKPNGEWLYKGSNTYPVLAKPQILILNLTNDYEYRFEVKALNAKGKSVESLPSNPVMVEAVLPEGWNRFLDKTSQRYYYFNIKMGKSRWSRPEEDPLFLEESILFNFEEREIVHLKALFDEDMHHYKELGVNQFVDVLLEVGEKCSKQWIAKLIKIYTKNGTKVNSWKTFMEIMTHIKRNRIKASAMLSKPMQIATSLYNRAKLFNILDSKRKKMGDWSVHAHYIQYILQCRIQRFLYFTTSTHTDTTHTTNATTTSNATTTISTISTTTTIQAGGVQLFRGEELLSKFENGRDFLDDACSSQVLHPA